MVTYLLAFLLGVVTGLRSMTAPAAVSWAARLGWLHLESTPLAFLGFAAAPYIVTVLAIGELINDKLPKTPSRKTPVPFAARIVTGRCLERLSAPQRARWLAACWPERWAAWRARSAATNFETGW